ncbi:MAG: DNA polymerase/3'-5' exonuclease PolX [Candidatus Woykebacteria bacterium]
MVKKFTNKEVATLLRNVSAAHQVKGENYFQIRAYDLAADAVEHASSDIRAIWETGQLDQIPGIGSNIANYIDELFTTGKVRHFEGFFKNVPTSMFDLLKISGVGPKTAYKLAKAGVKNVPDLEEKIKEKLLEEEFSEKSLRNILQGIGELKRKSDRILLPVAGEVAKKVLEYLKRHKDVVAADSLGSLRRKVATVGDVDLSVASDNPKAVIEHFTKFPSKERVVEAGGRTATIAVRDGIHVDLMVQPPQHYGSLLHHFTGSKAHNIHMRSLAREKGYSISEYGIKELKTDKVRPCQTEDEVYSLFEMQTPPPELREDTGEIEAALKNKLPGLVELSDIKGDLHTHSFWSDGQDSIEDMAKAAASLGREYIALTDHSYPSLKFDQRLKEIEQFNYSQDKIRVISGLEVNINANSTLQVPDEILAKHDIIFVSIHTSFRQPKKEMTNRILKALENPHVDVFAHPTGRLLLEREGINADWGKIFRRAGELGKFLEIDGYPNRLDLPDNLVREAKEFGVRFTVDTDSHQINHLTLMEYGISVARRGWADKGDIINSLPYAKLKDILEI